VWLNGGMKLADVVIVGGGVIGASVALALAERALDVLVLEAGRIGRGASWAAAGLLAPDWSGSDPADLTTLVEDSLALWPEWSSRIEDRAGVGVGYRRDGLLNLQADPEASHLPHDLATERPPVGAGEWLTASQVRSLEPGITGPILGGVFDPEVAQVDNPRLTPAVARAAADLGVRFRIGAIVAGLTSEGGRCTGVRLIDGSVISSGSVVLAAGAWSGPLADSMGIELPAEPWRGQMLSFDAVARPFRHVVLCGEMVLIPRGHGPLLVGTTLERVGFDARVTLSGMTHILSRADRMVPGLGDLPLARTWAGLRPGTPDQLPYLGAVPGWSGLFAATGHGRKGLILAPITAEIISREVIDGSVDPRAVACLVGRVGRRS
jgi:glycine oxidase